MMSSRGNLSRRLGLIPLVLLAAISWLGEAKALMEGPLRVHPSNPRYFTDGSRKAIYLTGSHTWATLQDITNRPLGAANFSGYLDFLQKFNHNFIRLWTLDHAWDAGANYRVEPQPYSRTGPGNARDGKPRFDVSRFSQDYFDRLRSRATAAQARGIYVAVMLFNHWGIGWPNTWHSHPFNRDNNVNGVDGDPNRDGIGLEVQTLAIPAIVALQENYVRKIVDTLNDLDNVLYEVSNESESGSWEWQHHMITLIHRYESSKPKQHPVGMTSGGARAILQPARVFHSPAEWVSPGSDRGYPDYRANPPASDGRKVIISDTDHYGWEYLRYSGAKGQREWVWKSFLRGLNPVFMDPYLTIQEGRNAPTGADPDRFWDPIRQSMGHVRGYAERIDLADLTPRNELASTAYCLANPGSEYLVYQPASGSPFWVNLAAGTYNYEWFSSRLGTVAASGTMTTGAEKKSFKAPFTGDAVLFLVNANRKVQRTAN